MTCPKCGSANLGHKDHDMKQMNHAVKHHGSHQAAHAISGHPAGLIFVAGCWVAMKAIHAIAKPWTCKSCDHRF